MKTSKKVDFQATEAYYEGERGKSTMKKDYSEEKKLHMIALGKRIKEHRERLGLSQDELAKRCGHDTAKDNGRSWVYKIEKGINDVPVSELKQLSKALGVTCLELMHEAEEQKFCDLFKQCQDSQAFRLVQYFIELNATGRDILLEYAEDMSKKEKYQKEKAGSSEDMAM